MEFWYDTHSGVSLKSTVFSCTPDILTLDSETTEMGISFEVFLCLSSHFSISKEKKSTVLLEILAKCSLLKGKKLKKFSRNDEYFSIYRMKYDRKSAKSGNKMCVPAVSLSKCSIRIIRLLLWITGISKELLKILISS